MISENSTFATLHAQKALIDQLTKNIFLKGKVIGKLNDILIEGRNFFYRFDDAIIVSDNQSRYTNQEFITTASKALINLKTKQVTLGGGVSTIFLANPSSNNSNHSLRLTSN